MPSIIHVPNLRDGYVDVARRVLHEGTATAPRGQRTYEILDAIVVVDDPTDALPVGVGRKLNAVIGYAEALQLIAGEARHDLLPRISPNFNQFRQEDGRFWGAYGDRIGTQMLAVERKLKQDRDSRQAVITLWDPRLDNQDAKRDYPCTVMLQFLIRNDKLVMHTTMRSNDVWWGLAYDAFQFSQAQLTLAHALGLEAGPYHHHAVSLHVYERDVTGIERLHHPIEHTPRDRLKGVGTNGYTMADRMVNARMLLNGDLPPGSTHTERVFHRALSKATADASSS